MEEKIFSFRASAHFIEHLEKCAKKQKTSKLQRTTSFVREMLKKATKYKEPKIEII